MGGRTLGLRYGFPPLDLDHRKLLIGIGELAGTLLCVGPPPAGAGCIFGPGSTRPIPWLPGLPREDAPPVPDRGGDCLL